MYAEDREQRAYGPGSAYIMAPFAYHAPGGECVAGFRPDRFYGCRHAKIIPFYWDGARLAGPDGCFL